ncbi:MAG TPA: PQQ-dependent sugar dehydrogenase [Solirubrobacterales bacterium]|nr:PQQ-dependent sugar dehydrogenase [Solirubrobacterales bacterium]
MLWAGSAQALTLQQIGSNFEEPIYVTSDPGNPERLFVVERRGSILLMQNGETKPFADISAFVGEGGERGLLSIAPSPDFDFSGRLFLDYVDAAGAIHVAEMTAGGSSAASSTLRDVIPPIPHPGESNHYGGQLQFGPEGALFISTGDGGGQDDEHHNSQNPDSKLGKILRLPSPGPLKEPEVWALGLRNPFRFSFDRTAGSLWIGDVGQDEREEVDTADPALNKGINYGWNCFEGSIPGPGDDEGCAGAPADAYALPVFEYAHSRVGSTGAGACAIIGGYVARGPGMGGVYGRYVYGDLCEGDIRSFSPTSPFSSDRLEGPHVNDLNSFGEDACGRLYAVSGNGPVYRLNGPETASCFTGTGPDYTTPQKAQVPSFIGIRAVSRKVRRHRRGLVTAWVTPCEGRRGDPVTLWRGRRNLGTRYLDRACSARFRPRIDRRSTFRTTVRADEKYLSAISRKLTIKPVRRHR